MNSQYDVYMCRERQDFATFRLTPLTLRDIMPLYNAAGAEMYIKRVEEPELNRDKKLSPTAIFWLFAFLIAFVLSTAFIATFLY